MAAPVSLIEPMQAPKPLSKRPHGRGIGGAAMRAKHMLGTDAELPRDVRCEYPSKYCNSHKALKDKGGMHKFCEYHRRKANQNQKRWQQRRREQRDKQRQKYEDRKEPVKQLTKTMEEVAVELEEKHIKDAQTPPPPSLSSGSFEPFPISDFTATPPPYADVMHMSAPPLYFTSNSYMRGFQCAGQLPEQDDLDVLSQMLFNDSAPPSSNVYGYPNWPATKIEDGFEVASGYMITGNGAAIV